MIRSFFKFLLFPACMILLSLSSCSSGTWEDDEDNWQRAFNVAPPKNIHIKHSWYWRSPHFTVEEQYFFEVAYSDSLEKMLLGTNDLVKLDSTHYNDIYFFDEKPNWFVPGNFDNYVIFTSTGSENYFLFIDKRKQSIYFTDFQV